jgi:uncharacterized BrkB/YihY/UPF0761 family membrane protein
MIKMEKSDSSYFCPRCGAPLRASDTFCTSCGASRDGRTSNAPQNQQYNRQPQRSNRLIIIGVLSAIWAAIALWWGLDAFFSAEASMDAIWNDPAFGGTIDMLEEFGITYDFMVSMVIAIGVVFIVSGALAAITAVLALTRKYYTVALIACILSAVLALIIIIGAIGLIVAYMLTKEKGEFNTIPKRI